MFFVPLLATIFLAMVPDKSELYKGSCIIDATNDLFDENHMLRLVNAERKKVHVQPLTFNSKLKAAAQCHSAYQARNKHMSHDGFKRSSVGLRVKKKGYFFRSCAENVAFNQRSVEEVVEAWMNSPDHRRNILSPKYKEFGAGMVNYYWTQNFGKHR
ncbi:hypothetical protein DSO57_1037903 [Entomophthora muscae]|uniref:Uncharacterized protein n=1 Tax=Entomophthora muscae TaxID=34485 RepID=A0ACC2S0Y4_9FUNG|nr:hypothetical protein DSO57_1037903 [Entomophthora muscae]